MCVCVYMCVCMCVYIYVYVCAYMYVCVCVCVCTYILLQWSLPKNTKSYGLYRTNPGNHIPQNSSCTVTYLPSLKLFQLDEQDMQDTAGEVRTNSSVTFFCGPLLTDEQMLHVWLELIYNRSVRTQDVVPRTYRMQWTIETNDVGESEKSVLTVRHDIYIYIYMCVCVCVCND